MRRRLFYAWVILVCLAAGVAALIASTTSRINAEAFAKITRNMTRDEVEELLGEPGAIVTKLDYSEYENVTLICDNWGAVYAKGTSLKWAGDQTTIFVHFRPDGRVSGASFMEPHQESLHTRLYNWALRLW